MLYAAGFQFAREVIDALEEICPCHTYDKDEVGREDGEKLYRITIESGSPEAEAFCDCYCSHRAGCNLVRDIVTNESWDTSIWKCEGDGNRHGRIPNGRDTFRSVIDWNPDRKWRRRGERGKDRRPASIGLAHELVHAHNNHSGRHMGEEVDEDSGLETEEINATRGENQIRDEYRREFPRKSRRMDDPRDDYDGKEVPNPREPHLDGSDRYDCGCDEDRENGANGEQPEGDNQPISDPEQHKETVAHQVLIRPLNPASGDPKRLVRKVQTAHKGRQLADGFQVLSSRFTDVADGDADFALAEWVSRDDSRYHFIFTVNGQGELRILTSLIPEEGDCGRVTIKELERVVGYSFPLKSMDSRFARTPFELPFQEGIGGRSRVDDGSVAMLTRRHKGKLERGGLYGELFIPLASRSTSPASREDLSRYKVIQSVINLWQSVLLVAARSGPDIVIPFGPES